MQLHFKELGRGEPLVMLHGLFGSLDNWLGVAPKFAQNFRVFLLDLRNHGTSPHSGEMNYPALAGDIAEFLDTQKLDRARLLGHSLGGKVAMQLALTCPARVEKLVIVDITPRPYPPDHNKIFRALLALDLSQFQSRRQIEEVLAPEIPDLTLRRFLIKNLAHEPSGADASISARQFRWKINLRGIFDNYPKLLEPITAQTPFAGPTLFLRGGRSPYISENDTPLIRELFPQAKIETIPQADHWVHADAPEEFVRLISAFLAPDLQ